MGKFVIEKITNNKIWYLMVVFIILPLNIRFILNGDVFLGIVLTILQIPYLMTRFKEIWFKKILNTDISGYNSNTTSVRTRWGDDY